MEIYISIAIISHNLLHSYFRGEKRKGGDKRAPRSWCWFTVMDCTLRSLCELAGKCRDNQGKS